MTKEAMNQAVCELRELSARELDQVAGAGGTPDLGAIKEKLVAQKYEIVFWETCVGSFLKCIT